MVEGVDDADFAVVLVVVEILGVEYFTACAVGAVHDETVPVREAVAEVDFQGPHKGVGCEWKHLESEPLAKPLAFLRAAEVQLGGIASVCDKFVEHLDRQAETASQEEFPGHPRFGR